PLASKLRSGRTVQKSRNILPIEAFPFHQFSFWEGVRLYRSLAIGPARQLSTRHVNGVHIPRPPGIHDRKPQLAAVMLPAQSSNHTGRQLWQRSIALAARGANVQHADARLIGYKCDALAVVR